MNVYGPILAHGGRPPVQLLGRCWLYIKPLSSSLLLHRRAYGSLEFGKRDGEGFFREKVYKWLHSAKSVNIIKIGTMKGC